MPAPFVLVVTTVGSRDEADRLARALVEQRLAACAQISAIDSCYVWEGEVRHEAEFRILFKVAASAYDAAERSIRALHSYDLPAIQAIPIERAHAPYADWVVANSTPRPDL